jgi:twinkle protein
MEDKLMNWSDLGIQIGGRSSGQMKAFCPKCHNHRSDKRDKSLSCNLDTGAYMCHYCNWSGNINSNTSKKQYKRPVWQNNTHLSDEVVKWFESRWINQSTLQKLNITEDRVFMPQDGRDALTISFNYFVNGELINVKSRSLDKHFKLVPNAELVPYNIDSIHGKNTCIITEGEIDCLSLVQCGFDNAISVPNGATTNLTYLDRFIDSHFEDKEEIIIAVDTDKKGLELRSELIRRFGAERCKVVDYGNDCKDINELLCKPGFGFEAVKNAVFNATYVKVEGIFELDDVRKNLDSLYENGLDRGATIGHLDFDNLISWVPGRLCVVTGIPSHGKSEFLDEIIYRLNLRYKWRVACFSPENHPLEWHISKVMSKLTGKEFNKESLSLEEYEDVKEYVQDNYYFIAPEDSSDLDIILDKAAVLVRRKGIKMLVIDPYNKLEHNISSGMSETQYISKFLDRLIMFAKKHSILLFLVAHPTKMKKENGTYETPNLYSISGSSHFYNKTDYGLCVYRDFEQDIVRVNVQKVKFKHLGKNGEANFHYDIANGRYVPVQEGYTLPAWDRDNHLQKQQYNDKMHAEQEQGLLDCWDLPE